MPLVSLHDELVGATDHLDVIGGVELRHHVATEQVSRPPGGHAPALGVLRVTPEQVTHGPVMRHLLLSVNGPDLVQGLDAGAQAAVHAEDLSVNDGGEGEVVEDLCAVSPHRDASVLPETLVIEPVHLGDLPGLVVAADQVDSIWVAHLERQQQQEGLHTVEASVHKVAHEQVVCVRHIASDFKQLLEIIELTMNVTTNGDW